uniref:Uncharacterized protein n=1 Tax=Arundo donax TaxID=35708 RepID=A0A0A8ZG05_ARUDO
MPQQSKIAGRQLLGEDHARMAP